MRPVVVARFVAVRASKLPAGGQRPHEGGGISRLRRRIIVAFAAVVATTVGSAGARSLPEVDGPRWLVTDLGVGEAVDLNERGQAVGTMTVRRAGERGSAHAFVWQNGRRLDLGTLPLGGGADMPNMSEAVAINERGHVIGKSYVDQNDPVFVSFLWSGGTMHRLACATPARMNGVVAVNANGLIAGWCGESRFSRGRAVVWQGVTPRQLPQIGRTSVATGINARGQVVGTSGGRAVMWHDGKLRDLGPGDAYAINELGQVVGTSRGHATMWHRGRRTDLGTLRGWRYSEAIDINERGQVVGVSFPSWEARITGPYRAFLWMNGRIRDLGTLGGSSSLPAAINDEVQIVGGSSTAGGRSVAFLWEKGRMTRLPGLAAAASSTAVAINNNGAIVGSSAQPPAPSHAVLWRRK